MFADVKRLVVVCLLVTMPAAAQTVLVGSGTSTTASARVMENGGEVNEVLPTPTHTLGVTVAHADVNGDSFPDIITGAAGGAAVQVFNGTSNAQLHNFHAYTPTFTGGVFVAAGDVNGDGHDDIVTGPGEGGVPNVRVFDGVTGGVLHSFFAYPVDFTGGVRVASADYNGDKHADIITGTGPSPGGNPHVKVFSGVDGSQLASFLVLPGVTGGIFVAAGDLDQDGAADIVVGAGNGEPDVRVYSGETNSLLTGFAAFPVSYTGGVRVGVVINDQDPTPYIVAGTGAGVQTTVKTFAWPSLAVDDTFTPYGTGNTGGVYVAGFDTRPTATIVNQEPVCFPDAIEVELTGRGSWRLTWSDGVVSHPFSTSFERQVHVPGTYMITSVEDLNHDSGFTSGVATVTDAGGPVFTTHPQTHTIQSGLSASLEAFATGGTVQYSWWEDTTPQAQFVGLGATFESAPLTVTTRFFALAKNETCSRMSEVATVHVIPPAPTGLIATAASATTVNLDWNNVTGAATYDVYRNSGSGFTFVTSTASSLYTDTGRTAGTSYLYRVFAKSAEGLSSLPSAIDLATTVLFTDPALSPGVTRIKAAHVNELRTAVHAVRTLAGLAPATYSNAILSAGEKVNAADIAELRTQLSAARSALSLPALTLDDPTLTAGATRIKTVHVQQLRNGAQ